MFHLAKLAGIAVLVWFYLTAKEKGESPVKWAIVGIIGYWIAWEAAYLAVGFIFKGLLIKNFTAIFMIAQIPALCAVGAAILIRKKLLADIMTEKS